MKKSVLAVIILLLLILMIVDYTLDLKTFAAIVLAIFLGMASYDLAIKLDRL